MCSLWAVARLGALAEEEALGSPQAACLSGPLGWAPGDPAGWGQQRGPCRDAHCLCLWSGDTRCHAGAHGGLFPHISRAGAWGIASPDRAPGTVRMPTSCSQLGTPGRDGGGQPCGRGSLAPHPTSAALSQLSPGPLAACCRVFRNCSERTRGPPRDSAGTTRLCTLWSRGGTAWLPLLNTLRALGPPSCPLPSAQTRCGAAAGHGWRAASLRGSGGVWLVHARVLQIILEPRTVGGTPCLPLRTAPRKEGKWGVVRGTSPAFPVLDGLGGAGTRGSCPTDPDPELEGPRAPLRALPATRLNPACR